MEWIGDRAAHDAARRAHPILVRSRVLLGRALALALLAPTLPPSQDSTLTASARQAPPSQDSTLTASDRQGLPPALATRFSEGVTALSAGQLDLAEAAFRDVLRDGGDRAFVRHNLGIVLQQRGRHADALVQFRAASRLDPAFGPSHLLAGTSLLAMGQARETTLTVGKDKSDDVKIEVDAPSKDVEKALQQQPNNPEAQSLLPVAEEKYIKHMYTAGGLSPKSVPQLLVAPSDLTTQQIDPQEGFVLSRINGSWDIQSILSICPFREADCLRMIKKLVERGVIGIKS